MTVNSSNKGKKVFVEIVNDLREMIQNEGIRPGEKIPSERVLAERLGVGRSSVREALRSLELLGLIETTHGGGTYLADYHNHQLVELLARFILPREEEVLHVYRTQQILERDAICEVALREEMYKLPIWESLLHLVITEGSIDRENLVRELIVATNNRLVYKIWLLLNQFADAPYKGKTTIEERPYLEKFLSNLRMGNPTEAIKHYEDWVDSIVKEP